MQPQRHKVKRVHELQFKMRPEQPEEPVVPQIVEYYGSREKAEEAIARMLKNAAK